MKDEFVKGSFCSFPLKAERKYRFAKPAIAAGLVGKDDHTLNKLAKIIRILTVAPFMALVMLVALYLYNRQLFGSPVNFMLAVVFLVLFPLLAYPIQPLIRKYRDKGREGQRTLAIFFAVAGYIGGCLSAFLLQAPKSILIIYLSYMLSGVLVMLLNKAIHFKASGHACGITGPFAILVYFGHAIGYLGIPILALVWLSSLKMKRHTSLQFIGGAVIPFAALSIVISLISFILK